jgi:lipid-binding SYLF domain-containing protein
MLICIQVVTAAPARSEAASAAEIDVGLGATFRSFESQVRGARELGQKAAGILVFLVKAGIGFGGEYGEGLLLIWGRPAGYYNLISASFGFQLGEAWGRKADYCCLGPCAVHLDCSSG